MIAEVSIGEISRVKTLAYKTWPTAFAGILSPEQIDYMLDMMYSDTSLTQQIEEKGHRFYIFSENGYDCGFISLEANHNKTSATKIHKIYVLPELHGKSIGKALINFAEGFALQINNNKLLLNVNRENKAVGFYKKMGFDITETVDIAIGEGFFMNDYVMSKTL